MRIGDLARQAGVSPSAVRYYESQALLDPPPRVSGQRVYPAGAAERLRVIITLRRASFSIREITRVVRAIEDRYARASWHPTAHARLDALDRRAANLELARGLLRDLLRCPHATLAACTLARASRRKRRRRRRPG